MDTIRGQVDSVRIVREGWGILVLLHGSARERAEVTGHPLGVSVGDTIECDGVWSQHPRFGPQFKARAIRVVAPSDAAGVIEWMISRLPNVGRKIATAIVERWGVDGAWEVLEHSHEELIDLDGITPERAERIHEAYMKNRAERDRMVQLKAWGLTDKQIAKILEEWPETAIEELRRDPYQLAELIDGFGFQRADEVARRMGLPADDPSRVRAAILHLIDEAAGGGHVYVPAGAVVRLAHEMVGATDAVIRREANALLDAGKLVRLETRVYRVRFERAERELAKDTMRLVEEPPESIPTRFEPDDFDGERWVA